MKNIVASLIVRTSTTIIIAGMPVEWIVENPRSFDTIPLWMFNIFRRSRGSDGMNLKHHLFIPVAVILLGMPVAGCSSDAAPVAPPDDNAPQIVAATGNSQHLLWGICGLDVEQVGDSLEINIVVKREAFAHYDVTDWLLPPECDDCIEIEVNSFDTETRILDADVTLRNPTPLLAYDVRGILYTNEYGHELLNADDWTGYFDVLGGEDINPFRAFAKDMPLRKFQPFAEEVENYVLHIPKPPEWAHITFAVTASWPGNAREPYEIYGFTEQWLIEDYEGASGLIQVSVSDWQDDVNEVLLSAPEITGEDSVAFTHVSGDDWSLNLTNVTGASAGYYNAWIGARSENSGDTALFDRVQIFITETHDFELTDVTPPSLNFSPRDIRIDGDYAYVGALTNGLHIFDITDKESPVWVNRVEIPGSVQDMEISSGYAYVCYSLGYQGGFVVVDIDPP